MGCKSYGIISLTFVDLERSDQRHRLENRVSVQGRAIVTVEHYHQFMSRGSDGIINLTLVTLKVQSKVIC